MTTDVNTKLAKMRKTDAIQTLVRVSNKQNQIQVECFTFEEKNYEVRVYPHGNEIIAQAFLDNRPVSPRCTCDWETAWDFKSQHGQEAVKILVEWARDFVRNKTWEKYQQAMAELKKYSNK